MSAGEGKAPAAGHNGGPPTDEGAREALRSFHQRLARLDEEIKALNRDKSDVFAEARSRGFDVAALRAAMRWGLNPEASAERDHLRDLYLQALGLLR